MSDTIFDKIAGGEIEAYRIWENEKYLAFLTPFPNTPGATVVIPKRNVGDYVFGLDDEDYVGLMSAVREVSKLLERAFDVPRVALVFEGTGVAYVHAKLYPLHGEMAGETEVWGSHVEFYPQYVGYLTTVEGPAMPPEQLKTIQHRITGAPLQ